MHAKKSRYIYVQTPEQLCTRSACSTTMLNSTFSSCPCQQNTSAFSSLLRKSCSLTLITHCVINSRISTCNHQQHTIVDRNDIASTQSAWRIHVSLQLPRIFIYGFRHSASYCVPDPLYKSQWHQNRLLGFIHLCKMLCTGRDVIPVIPIEYNCPVFSQILRNGTFSASMIVALRHCAMFSPLVAVCYRFGAHGYDIIIIHRFKQ